MIIKTIVDSLKILINFLKRERKQITSIKKEDNGHLGDHQRIRNQKYFTPTKSTLLIKQKVLENYENKFTMKQKF